MSHERSLLLFLLPFFIMLSLPAYSAEEQAIASLRQTSKAFASVAKVASPSVAFIKVESVRSAPQNDLQNWPFGDELFRRFFGDRFRGVPQQRQPERRVMGQGSGFVFSVEKGLLGSKSYILTNNHVVEGGGRITVSFKDGREYEAKITGADARSDIAVLEIEESDHKAIPLGSSNELEVGEWVVALGNPFGLSHTLTVGVVSAKGRSGLGINDYEDFIQTDAAINPGNSGGPLLNLDGEVIGINTAIFSRSGGYMGVGFAIPISLARSVAEQLINSGEVNRGYLGVVIQELTPELADTFDLENQHGALIAQVAEGSPADQAGLRTGDLIIAYQGEAIENVSEFRNRVALTAPGSRVQMTLLRNGEQQRISVKLGGEEASQWQAEASAYRAEALGLSVQAITPDLAQQFAIQDQGGVLVSEVERGSIAAMVGIRPGMVIHQINKQTVTNVAEFKQRYEQSRNGKRVLLLISDRGVSRYVVLSWR